MKLLLKNTLQGLAPMYPDDYDEKRKLKIGETYMAEIKRPRNLQFHRKFRALINIVFLNLPEGSPIKSQDHLIELIKLDAGLYDIRTSLSTQTNYPSFHSLSFASMDEDQFTAFYNKAVDTILKYFVVDRDDLQQMIAENF